MYQSSVDEPREEPAWEISLKFYLCYYFEMAKYNTKNGIIADTHINGLNPLERHLFDHFSRSMPGIVTFSHIVLSFSVST
jgi:hypothetical protein